MTVAATHKGLTAFTLIMFWSCILLGLAIPLAATVGVDMIKHDQTFGQAWHQLRLHLFAPGYNLYLIGLFNAAPCVLFAIFTLLHLGRAPQDNRAVTRRRGTAVLVTTLAILGVSTWTHVMTLWYPDAQSALVYLFLPFALLGLMPVAYVLGRGLGWLIFR